jgi:hypothetical protein
MADEPRANFQKKFLNQYFVKSNNSTTQILVQSSTFESKRSAGCLMALDYFVAFAAIVIYLKWLSLQATWFLETFRRAEE